MDEPEALERVDEGRLGLGLGSGFSSSSSSSSSSKLQSTRAIMGRISDTGRSYLITGGTDRSINFWDFQDPEKCFVVSRPSLNENSGNNVKNQEQVRCYGRGGRLFVSVESEGGGRGGGNGNVVARADNSHRAAVTDLKSNERPYRGFISVGGDGVVKVWR